MPIQNRIVTVILIANKSTMNAKWFMQFDLTVNCVILVLMFSLAPEMLL